MALDPKERLSGDAALEKLRALLEDLPIAFMVTAGGEQTQARPVGVVGRDEPFNGSLWFITDQRSHKVAQIRSGARTSLVFQNDAKGMYAHMRGEATVVDDRPRLAALYTTDQRIWFPDGVDDPNMILIRFDVSEADYWDGHNSTVRRTIALLTSVITGRAGHEGHTGIAKLD